MTTDEMIEGCKRNDRKCQQLLFETYKRQMYALCCRYAKSDTEAEDMMQEGFIKVFRYLDSYKGSGSFFGWLCRIFINQAISIYRQQQIYNQMLRGDVPEYRNSVDSDEKQYFQVSEPVYSEEEMIDAIRKLPQYLQTIFNMVVIDEYSYAEVAEMLNISNNSVKTLMYRARMLLKDALTQNNPSRE